MRHAAKDRKEIETVQMRHAAKTETKPKNSEKRQMPMIYGDHTERKDANIAHSPWGLIPPRERRAAKS